MKTEKLLDEIGLISDIIIAEANTNTLKRKSAKRTWLGWVSVTAACLVVAVVAVLIPKPSEYFPELPMLAISEDMGSRGFEGYLAYNINELQNGNPWSEGDDVKSLPVFENPTDYDSSGKLIKGLSADEMIQKAQKTASLMNLTVDSIFTNPTMEDLQKAREKEASVPGNDGYESDSTPYEAVAICGDVTIKVEADGTVRVFFNTGVALPDRYSFTYYETTEKQAEDIMQYLLKQYAPVTAMKLPSISLFGDYNYNAQRMFSYEAYEGSGDLIDKILGYNFNRIRFSPNDDGALWVIDRYSADISHKIGDYPIITTQEARKLLLQRRYITTVPEELPGARYIAKVELVYRTGRYDKVFMPYYRFLVELPSMQRENNLKTFGAFYVPAVDERYISNMPLWNGSFN